jgi:magnesium-transporting ATPase (P-type)
MKNQSNLANEISLIITGEAFHVLTEDMEKSNLEKLYYISSHCNSVIGCRVSPKQKRDIVHFYKIQVSIQFCFILEKLNKN